MNILVDTHVLLWWLDDSPKLSVEARRIIANGENAIFISAAVIWEIRIKQALGKIKIPTNFQRVLGEQAFLNLDIRIEHAHQIARLPDHHRDPFDRMLVAQATYEDFQLLTGDENIMKYDVAFIKV